MRGHETQVHLTVAAIAGIQRKRGDIALMTIIAGEWFTRSRQLMSF
jgi:hypothetical protein